MSDKTKIKISEFLPYILSVLILIVIALIVFTLINNAKKNMTTYKTKNPVDIYFYIQDVKFEYESKITISSEDEIIKLTTEGYEHEFESEPIFYKDKKEVLFPNKMIVIQPTMNFIQKKIRKFSSVYQDDEIFKLKNVSIDYQTNSAVLYDGNDLYFFTNPTTIEFANQKIEIGPYSYVIFNFNKELHIYDYAKDKMIIYENLQGEVFARNPDYNINLGIDAFIDNGETKLFMKNFEYLKELENEK